MIGALLGLRFTALALIPAALLITAIAAGYGLATHQSSMVLLSGLLATLVLPQLCFALAMYSKSWIVSERALPDQIFAQTR
jgi:hypothetical protein